MMINYIQVRLQYTCLTVDMPKVKEIAERNGITIVSSGQIVGVTRWTIEKEMTLADLSNFSNDLGLESIHATCSDL